ncbi:MAG: hypothetical protein ABIN97_09060 [Ginsengibacter sp.]
MNNKFFTLCIAALFISSISFATIRRVGFFGPAVANVDYATLQLAHDAADPGDTIMMHPGSQIYATITKRLVVIGPGYFLSQNSGLQANTNGTDSTASGLYITDPAANGSIFIGCTFAPTGIYITGVGVANVSFIRCWFNGYSGTNNYSIIVTQNINNFIFQQCVFKGAGVTVTNPAIATNISFINCLFYNINDGQVTYSLNFGSGLQHSGLFQNCIFSQAPGSGLLPYLDGTWAMNNCITNVNYFTGSGITYQNNIGTSTQFPAGNGNQQNKLWSNIFTLTGSQDGQYTLKAGSPAIGGGISGANCGIFGGTTPYRLSGIPSVPTIYSITSPQSSTPTVNTVQINLSTRSNN